MHQFDRRQRHGLLRQVQAMKLQAGQAGEAPPRGFQIFRVDIDAAYAARDRRVDVFQAVAAGDTQDGHRFRPAAAPHLTEELRKRGQLADRRGRHVGFVVVERNRESGRN